MALHAYSRIWLHVLWATLERRPLLPKPAAVQLSGFLGKYAAEKGIYMKINYVNADHVHGLIDLPTSSAVEDVMHLLKGASSHWVNENNLVAGKFAWGRGYGAFSVSHSDITGVAKYIAEQEEHHRKRGFADEVKLLIERHQLKWHEEGNR
ncbi:MAG TPA: transposase [Verrucomicrobiae bacterium]|nr:transposase [Verrucomicrobiae bacterium]